MPFFLNASGPILSIPIHSKVCQYDPCKVSLKKNDPFLNYEPPKVSVFLALVTGLVTGLVTDPVTKEIPLLEAVNPH